MIESVDDVIPKRYHKVILKQNIQDTAQLYELIAPTKQRRQFAKKTGISTRKLHSWAKFIDLMQVRGIGPKMVRVINACGIDTLKKFQKADAEALHGQMRVANRGAKYSEVLPQVRVIAAWITNAKQLKSKLK